MKYLKGGKLGTIEENFITKLNKGDTFLFAGKALELVMIRDMTVYVRKGKPGRAVARWLGGKLPLSESLGLGVRKKLREVAENEPYDPEMKALMPIIDLQKKISRVASADELLIEIVTTRDGQHHFIYPFSGRLAHEGLGSLLAYRVSKKIPISISVTATDYGLDLSSHKRIELDGPEWRAIFSPHNLIEDLLGCLNMTELAKHRFRDIVQIAGLVFKGYPGGSKTSRQLQASSSLFYEVFVERDPGNRLIEQARTEVLEAQLDVERIRRTLEQVQAQRIIVMSPARLTPFSFPIWADEIRARVSTESWSDRIKRMVVDLEEKNARHAYGQNRFARDRRREGRTLCRARGLPPRPPHASHRGPSFRQRPIFPEKRFSRSRGDVGIKPRTAERSFCNHSGGKTDHFGGFFTRPRRDIAGASFQPLAVAKELCFHRDAAHRGKPRPPCRRRVRRDRHRGPPAAFRRSAFCFRSRTRAQYGRLRLRGARPPVRPAPGARRRQGAPRLACFWFGKACAVLPSFGTFTGSHEIRPAAEDRVFVIAGGDVHETGV